MIIEDKKNPVTKLNNIPSSRDTLHLSWVYRRELLGERELAGFAVVYARGKNSSKQALAHIEKRIAELEQKLLQHGGWLGDAQWDGLMIRIVPADQIELKIRSDTFCAPCQIEVWTIARDGDGLHILYRKSECFCLAMRLSFQVKAKEYEAAEYGLFKRLKKPAKKGVQLILSAVDQNGDYIDGAVQYCVGGSIPYPIAHEALGKPLNFYSGEDFSFFSEDFKLLVDPEWKDCYELIPLKG